MDRYSEEESMLNRAIRMIKEDSSNEEVLKETEINLRALRRRLKKTEKNKYLSMRIHLIGNIFRIRLAMIRKNEEEVDKERRIFCKIDEASKNLSDVINAIECDLKELINKTQNISNYDYSTEILELLNETQFSYQLILSYIHELNSSMIVSTDTKDLTNVLQTIRVKNIDCLESLVKLFTSQSSETSSPISIDNCHLQTVQIDYQSFQNKLNLQSSNVKKAFEDLMNKCKSYDTVLPESENVLNVLSPENSSLNVSINKINVRLDHLIECIDKNIYFNYQEELSLLHERLSKLESDPIDSDKELQNEVVALKDKLTVLQDRIANKNPSDYGPTDIIKCNDLDFHLLHYCPETSISHTIENLKEFEPLLSDSSNTEDYFLDGVLSANEFIPQEKPFDNDVVDHEKLNQYKEQLRLFHSLVKLMKWYLSYNHIRIKDDNHGIEQQINNIKKIMMTTIITMSVLERYSNMISKSKHDDDKLFTPQMKCEALSLYDSVIKRLIINIKNQKLCSLFQEKAIFLIESMKLQEENLLTLNIYDEDKCKMILHETSWLINMWQYYGEKVQCFELTEKFQNLIELVNSFNKEKIKFIEKSHITKERNCEYWIEVLRDWQNRTEAQFIANVPKDTFTNSAEEWKRFHDIMYLICEFNQIDINMDHYEVKFEIDFMDFLRAHKYELDKSNKCFIDTLLERQEPMFKILHYISDELNWLKEQKSKYLQSQESVESIQKSTQINLQVLEYIDSLIDKIDGCDIKRTEIITEQIKKLRKVLQETKKAFLMQNTYFEKFFEDMDRISVCLLQADESIQAIEVLVGGELDTLLIESLSEMLKRSQETLRNEQTNLFNIETHISEMDTNKSAALQKSAEISNTKLIKIKENLNRLKERMIPITDMSEAIIMQQTQADDLKYKLQTYAIMADLFFTQIEIGSITTKESAQNYIDYIDKLLDQKTNQKETIQKIANINSEIIQHFPHLESLIPLFANEIEHFVNSLIIFQSLETTRKTLNEKLVVLTEIDEKYKSCTSEIETLKFYMVHKKENLNPSVLLDIENARHNIDTFINYLKDVHKAIDKTQMEKFTMDLEQLEILLDVYDDLLINEKNKKVKEEESIKHFEKQCQIYKTKLENYNKNVINMEQNLKENPNFFLYEMEAYINELNLLRNEIMRDSINIYVNNLKESRVFQIYNECFNESTSSIKRFSSTIIEFLWKKYVNGADLNDLLSEMCSHWIMILKMCLEIGDLEYHDKVAKVETIKVILECFKIVSQQSEHFALTSFQMQLIDSFKIKVTDLLVTVDEILKFINNSNFKLSSFYFLNVCLSKWSEKLSRHFILVQSLSAECSIQKYIHLKKQSMFYTNSVDQYKNLYQFFNNLCDLITEEKFFGFDIIEEIHISLENITKSIDGVSRKLSSSVEDIDHRLTEWKKLKESEISLRKSFDLLDDTYTEMTKGKNMDRIKEQMYIERLKIIVDNLDENEYHWCKMKVRIGSSSDREFIQQRIRITMSCVLLCRMLVADHDTNNNQLLCQYRELYLEAEYTKLDLLKLFHHLNSFYLEMELSIPEKEYFLDRLYISLRELEKTLTIWFSRLNQFYPDMIADYRLVIEKKWTYLQNSFKKNFNHFEEISHNHNVYKSLHDSLHIRLNVMGEYIDKLENCDSFVRNVLLNYHLYNTADIRNCLKIVKIIIDQMSDVQGQLNDLRQFKKSLHQLILGQNENSNDYDAGKIDGFKEVLDLITKSQISIRDKLLEIVSPKRTKLTLTYSCYEDNYPCSDKSISVDGSVESYDNSSLNESPMFGKTNVNDKILPISSIDAITKEKVNDLQEMYTKILASVDEEEEFLNEKWKNQSIESKTSTDLDKECQSNNQSQHCVDGSSINKGQIKMSDTHHWFPDTIETSSQTIVNSQNKASSTNINPNEVEDSEINKLLNIDQLATINNKMEEVKKIDVNSMKVTDKVQDEKSSYRSDCSEEEISYCKISSEQVENVDIEIYRNSLILNTESSFNAGSDNKVYSKGLNKITNNISTDDKLPDINDISNQESAKIESPFTADELEKEHYENNGVVDSNMEQMRMDSMSFKNSSQQNKHSSKIECKKEEAKTFTSSFSNKQDNVIEKINLETKITLESENSLNLTESYKNTVSQTHLKVVPIYRSESQIGNTIKNIDNQEINNVSQKMQNEEKELSIKEELDASRILMKDNDNKNINNTEGNSILETVHLVSEENSYFSEKTSKIDEKNNISEKNEDTDNREIDTSCQDSIEESNKVSYISVISKDEESANQSLYSNYENVTGSDNEISNEKYNFEEDKSQPLLRDQTDGDTSCSGGSINFDSINKNQDRLEDLIEEIHVDRTGLATNENLDIGNEIEEDINRKNKELNFSNFIDVLSNSKSDDNQEIFSDQVDCYNIEEEMIIETRNSRSTKLNASNDSDEIKNCRENQQINQFSKDNIKEYDNANNEYYVNGIKTTTTDNCDVHEIKVNDSMIISNTHVDCNEKIKVITKENNVEKTDSHTNDLFEVNENKFAKDEFSKSNVENNSNLENVGNETLEHCIDLNNERNTENPITGERESVIDENRDYTESNSSNVLEKKRLKENSLLDNEEVGRETTQDYLQSADKSKKIERDFIKDELGEKTEPTLSNKIFKQQSRNIINENCMNLNDDRNTEKHITERESPTNGNTNGSESNSSNISEDRLKTNVIGKLDSMHQIAEITRETTQDQGDISQCNPVPVDSNVIKNEKDKDKTEIQEIIKEEMSLTDGSQQKVSSTEGLICSQYPSFVPVNTKKLNSSHFKEDGQIIAIKSNSLIIPECSYEHESSTSDLDLKQINSTSLQNKLSNNGLESISGNTLKTEETILQDTTLVSSDTLSEKNEAKISLQGSDKLKNLDGYFINDDKVKDDKSDINDEEFDEEVKSNLSNQIFKQKSQDSINEKEEWDTHRNVDGKYYCENNALSDKDGSMKRKSMQKLKPSMDETDDAEHTFDSNGWSEEFDKLTITSMYINNESKENLSEIDNINQTNEIIKQDNNEIELNSFTNSQNCNDSSTSQESCNDSLKLLEDSPMSDNNRKSYKTLGDYNDNTNMYITVDQTLQKDVTNTLIYSNSNLDFDKSLSEKQIYDCKNVYIPDTTNDSYVKLKDSKNVQSNEDNVLFGREREDKDTNETTLKTNMNEDLYTTLNTHNMMEPQTSLISSNDPKIDDPDKIEVDHNFDENLSSKKNFSDNTLYQYISSSSDKNSVISFNDSQETIEKPSSDSQSDSSRDSLSIPEICQSQCIRKEPSENESELLIEKTQPHKSSQILLNYDKDKEIDKLKEISDEILSSESSSTDNSNDNAKYLETTSTDNESDSLSCATYKNRDDKPSNDKIDIRLKDVQINKVECSNNINLKYSNDSVMKKNSFDNKFELLASLMADDYDTKQSNKTHLDENEDHIECVKRPVCKDERSYSDNESESLIDDETQSLKQYENKEIDDDRDEIYEKKINESKNLLLIEDTKNNKTNISSKTNNEDLHKNECDQLPYTSSQFNNKFNVKDELVARKHTESSDTLRESVDHQETTGCSRDAEQIKDNISDADNSLHNTNISLPSLKDSQNDRIITEQSSINRIRNEDDIINNNLTKFKHPMHLSFDEPINEFTSIHGLKETERMPTKYVSYMRSEDKEILSDNSVDLLDRNEFTEDNDGTDDDGNDNDNDEGKDNGSDGDGDDEDDNNDEIGDCDENNYNDEIGDGDGKDNDSDGHDDGDGNDEDDDGDGNDEDDDSDGDDDDDENSECEDKLISPSVYPENQLEITLNENENVILSNNAYTSKKKSVLNCCLLLLLSLLLAILILLLFIPNLPIVTYCKNPVYHILHNINPFDIKRSVPV